MSAVKTKPGIRRRIGAALPWVWLAGAWLFGVVFMRLYGRSLLDSDMASEMVLAAQLNREGSLLSANWYYSTELRVFCEQLLFKLGLAVFPQDWHAARTLAQGLLSALVAVSALYFAYGARLRKSAPWIAGALLCPFGFWQLFHGVFGGFYYVHMVFVMPSMGLVLRLAGRKSSARRTALRAAALAVLAFAAGLNGVRILMNLYAPLLAASLVLLALRWNRNRPVQPLALVQLRLALAALGTVLCSAAGYAVNAKVLAAEYTFSDQGQRGWTALDLSKLLTAWGDFLALFGYPGDRGVLDYSDPVPLFSVAGLLGAVSLLIAGAVVVSAVHLVLRRRELCFEHRVLLTVFLSCLLVDGMVFAFLNDMIGINGSYWLPVVPLAFGVLAVEGQTLPLREGISRAWLAAAFAAALVCVSVSTTLHFVQDPPRGDAHLEDVSDWLVENGYTRGYATFWYANVLTELSDGTLEVWTVDDMTRMNLHEWLQSMDHRQAPEGKVFLLIDPTVARENLAYTKAARVVYEDDYGYMILEAPDAVPQVEASQAAEQARIAQRNDEDNP